MAPGSTSDHDARRDEVRTRSLDTLQAHQHLVKMSKAAAYLSNVNKQTPGQAYAVKSPGAKPLSRLSAVVNSGTAGIEVLSQGARKKKPTL